jgi:hypothetical protein
MLRIFDPSTSLIFPPCLLHEVSGWYCPGCGSLRALHQLLHGNLSAAFAMNPLTIVLLPFLIYGIASWFSFQHCGRYFPSLARRASQVWGLGAAILLFGIVRNVPVYPFTLLVPGGMLIS